MRILRFDIYARVLHWSHAVVFLWLLITGVQLFFTTGSLLGDPLIRKIHLYASFPFVFLPGLIYIAGGRSAQKDVKDLMNWTEDDVRWFMQYLKKNRPLAAGKFNGGQRANFMATLLLITGLSFSGFVVWMKSMFSVDFVELNFLIHDFLAIMALSLLTGHIAMALYYSESLRGIISGVVDEKWAEEHYPAWQRKQIK